METMTTVAPNGDTITWQAVRVDRNSDTGRGMGGPCTYEGVWVYTYHTDTGRRDQIARAELRRDGHTLRVAHAQRTEDAPPGAVWKWTATSDGNPVPVEAAYTRTLNEAMQCAKDWLDEQ